MTAALDAAPQAPAELPAASPASWAARAGAFLVDVVAGVATIATMVLLWQTAPPRSVLWWIYAAVIAVIVALTVINRLVMPTITGWSLGRALFGIAVRKRDGSAVGAARLLGRDLAHLFDTAALLIGWLWPLWDRRRRTFADLLLRTEVHKVERPKRDMHRPTAAALIAAAVMCVGAVGLGYLTEYGPARAVATARQQVADQGPRIVEQLLSYNADTLQQDFSHAQSLATDGYRPQLIAQQQAVQKAGATSNQYFAVSTAVLSATADQAAMLMAMQGQRGANASDFKFITATVRVDFEKSRDGQWRVANLIVLKKPQMSQVGQ
ncbi:RDD family protein [Mycobacterium sp. NPDC048908]|uniref:RDD family protein n=1 Tax=Mycobacterium sp. NPDC048908 TaxID=3364292 RepID=UPI0037181A0B